MLVHGLVPILCWTKQSHPNTKRVHPILYIAASKLKEESIPNFNFNAYMLEKANVPNKLLDEAIVIKEQEKIHEAMRHSIIVGWKRACNGTRWQKKRNINRIRMHCWNDLSHVVVKLWWFTMHGHCGFRWKGFHLKKLLNVDLQNKYMVREDKHCSTDLFNRRHVCRWRETHTCNYD